MSTAAGVVVGLILFLAMALMSVIAVNGTSSRAEQLPPQAAAAGAGATTSQAEPEEGDKSKSLRSLDLDRDGRLSLAEASGHPEIVRRFHRLDRDRDGKLTQSEFDRLAKPPRPKAATKKPARRPQPTRPG